MDKCLGCWSFIKQARKTQRVVKPSAMSLLTIHESLRNWRFIHEGEERVVWKPPGSEKTLYRPEICGVQKDELPLLKVTEGEVVSSGLVR